jgi:glutathione S-transferase
VSALTLYDYELDEQCYKVRLLLSVLDCPYQKIAVDAYPGREQQSEAFLKLNPLGALPILTDEDVVLCGAEPILAYLANKYDGARAWLPEEATRFGRTMQWLSFAAGALHAASLARVHALFEQECDEIAVLSAARHSVRLMDDHMTKQAFDDASWFVGRAPTIADIALFPAIALSRDFGIDHDEFPALRRWMRRIRTLPRFITMPGIPAFY